MRFEEHLLPHEHMGNRWFILQGKDEKVSCISQGIEMVKMPPARKIEEGCSVL